MYKNYKELKKDPIFKEYIGKKTVTEISIRRDAGDLLRYCQIQNMTLSELYYEADKEEDEGIREKNRKLTKRLETLRQDLLKKGYSTTVIIQTFNTTKNFYKVMRIAVPYIPPVSLPETQIGYEDIPNKKHIQQALDTTNNRLHKALILFMFSSCSAVAETLTITCQMFIDATKEYHNQKNIIDVVDELDGKKDVIPFFKLKRQKMKRKYAEGYKYYTCCTPEATEHIIKYLKHRIKRERSYKKHELNNKDKLFKISPFGVTAAFQRINDHADNNWGKIDYTRFFHPHSMRIAANTIIANEDDANLFSGRKRSKIHEVYFKKNPLKIKEIYEKYIPDLSIEETKMNLLDGEATKKLKKENKELTERVVKLEAKEGKRSKIEKAFLDVDDETLGEIAKLLQKNK